MLTSPLDLAMKRITNMPTFETLKKVRESSRAGWRAGGHAADARKLRTSGGRFHPASQVTQNVAQQPAEPKFRKLKCEPFHALTRWGSSTWPATEVTVSVQRVLTQCPLACAQADEREDKGALR